MDHNISGSQTVQYGVGLFCSLIYIYILLLLIIFICSSAYSAGQLSSFSEGFLLFKGVLHLQPQISMFVLYLKIVNTFLKNNICIL